MGRRGKCAADDKRSDPAFLDSETGPLLFLVLLLQHLHFLCPRLSILVPHEKRAAKLLPLTGGAA